MNPRTSPRNAAFQVASRLRDAGFIAYLAGGCVRDELLQLHPKDYDIATDATPNQIHALFKHADLVGAHFGVCIVRHASHTIEVATFRTDGPYSNSRHPDQVVFSDPETDAQRRDFTINALFLDPFAHADHQIIDFVGGLDDLRNGVVRAVGDPDKRLDEDHLRALRAIRFSARFQFQIDPPTGDAIRRHAKQLKGVSRERIGEELRRMLLDPSRADAVRMMQDHLLDASVLDEPHLERPVDTLAALHDPPMGVALAAIALDRFADPGDPLHDPQPIVTRWRRSLCLSNDDQRDMIGALTGFSKLFQFLDQPVAHRKRSASAEWFPHAHTICAHRQPDLSQIISENVRMLEETPSGLAPSPLLTGDDLVEIGFTPGPRFKVILDRVYDAQLEDRITTLREAMELAGEIDV